MRKIRKTKLAEIPAFSSEDSAAVSPFAQAQPEFDAHRAFSAIPAPEADSPDARLHYLGAVVHAAPPVLAVEATRVEATRMDGGENSAARQRCPEEMRLRGREIVMEKTLLACGMGLVPLPLADLAGGTLVTAAMLRALAENYGCAGVAWTSNSTTALFATLTAVGGGGLVAGLFLRLVPVAGRALANAALPATMGVAAYAVGMAAVEHFESGRGAEPPTLAVLLAGARRGRKGAERKVASLIGRDTVRLKA